MKSALIAYRVAWVITRQPDVRILYISSTANLAIKQLKFIKDILTSDVYRKYWPDMVHPDEGKREKWTETEISVDHPLRKKESVRDPTVFVAGLTTGIVGLHCDKAVLDDVVTGANAFTKDGRDKVRTQYSFLSSIEAADAEEWVVGTRYFPSDLYHDMQEMVVETYDEEGTLASSEELYEVFERQVEDIGDGSGNYLWPKQQRHDGKWFGFDQAVLAKKKAQYLDQTQFRAQYYNNPNDPDNAPVTSFQYFEPQFLSNIDGFWHYKSERLNVYAAIDFAFSLGKRADWTAIVVVGIDSNSNYYVLEIARFKTNLISEYFDKLLKMHIKWGFRKLRAEITSAQKVIVKDLKENYIRPSGLALSVDEKAPTRHEGTKAERVGNTLQPRYQNGQMWHGKGGNWSLLEEEMMMEKPPHDDIKDALASAIDICVPPSGLLARVRRSRNRVRARFNPRFGGVG
jgi:phage terminase large subunit-like protein